MNETGPIGLVAFVAAVSVAVAVQSVDVPTMTEEGTQATDVVVGSTFWVTVAPLIVSSSGFPKLSAISTQASVPVTLPGEQDEAEG